jgi:hypothetical protein
MGLKWPPAVASIPGVYLSSSRYLSKTESMELSVLRIIAAILAG